ncbi:MAG: A/G-specific adenine glycosylase [Candidatus Acidiferrum sp.]|jgi:A/G-specific adenine glycosylase
MLSRVELRALRKNLPDWFRAYRRELPWRLNKDPYRIWLSEIMLQQTRVAAVIPYFERFLSRFPTIAALAEAPAEEVLRLWSGLGYYSRARNLQGAAQQIVARHAGRFPASETALRALPGIGAYTSAAILSIAFEQPLAVLDGNVARVLARLFAVRGQLREPSTWRTLQGHADQLLEHSSPGDWNQAMMELGATVCTPRAPQCMLCPFAKHCAARQQGLTEEIPEKRRKRAPAMVTLAAAVFVDQHGLTLLLPPPASSDEEVSAEHVPSLVSKMWHFPTIAANGEPRGELEQHLHQLCARQKAGPLVLTPLAGVRHTVTYRKIAIVPFRIAVKKLPAIAGAKVVALKEASTLAISGLTRKIVRAAMQEPGAGALRLMRAEPSAEPPAGPSASE